MKKGLLFVGLIVAMTLFCCYALIAADATQSSDAALSKGTASFKQDPAAAQNVHVEELYQRMQELKSQGLYDPDLWDEYYDATPRPQRPPRHTDEGGETCSDCEVVPGLPYVDTGYTCDNINDYDEVCPYTGSTSPDVVYCFAPTADICVDISLCHLGAGTDYDTKLYVYEGSCPGTLIACNDDDDTCDGVFQSQILDLNLIGGDTYYIVVDGYYDDCGNYKITIDECEPPPPPPECPENTLFGQRPSVPPEYVNAYVSDTASSYIAYENFWEITTDICDIHWWGLSLYSDPIYGWTECDEDPMDFVIIFYPNLAGAYGPDVSNPVCTYNVTVTRQATGVQFDEWTPLYYWETTLDPCCDITDGWVSIHGTSVGSPTDCWFLWGISPFGDDMAYQNDYIIGTDLAFCLTEEVEEYGYDLGDFNAPCDYVSLPWQSLNHPPMVPGNPAHTISGIAWLGANITAEAWADPAGHDNAGAIETFIAGVSDSTDDGVVFTSLPLDICRWETVDVFVSTGPNWPIYEDTANGALYLSAWKDGNLDADFDDELCGATWPPSSGGPADLGSEWIIWDVPVTPGLNTISFFDPGLFDLVPYEPVFRFRLFGSPHGRYGYSLADPTICAEPLGTWQVECMGEVEDYNITEFYQLPVELTTLEAIAGDRQVTLSWTTATEQDNAYFEVQRMSPSSDWITVGTVEGTNEATGSSYEYTDQAVVNGVTYTYRLLSHDINGTVHEYEQTVEATPEAPMPMEYALEQNFPNPFNPNTTISYALKEAGFVTLKIYNLLGQEVVTLVSQRMESGRYTATFTAKDLPSGVYIYRLEVNDFTATKKMVLMK